MRRDRCLVPALGGNVDELERAIADAQTVYHMAGQVAATTSAADPVTDFDVNALGTFKLLELARAAVAIERHYGMPMDVEWAKDGDTGAIFVVQARPETVQSRKEAGTLKSYELKQKGKRLLTGLAIGDAIAAGKVLKLASPDEIERFEKDAVLVTGMTDPDWVPLMRRAAGIVTDHGGRTSHAAIVSRELGIPAVIGTGDATRRLETSREVTISCGTSVAERA